MNLSNPSAFEKCQESGLPRVDTFDTNKDKQSSGNNVLFQDLEKQNKTKSWFEWRSVDLYNLAMASRGQPIDRRQKNGGEFKKKHWVKENPF